MQATRSIAQSASERRRTALTLVAIATTSATTSARADVGVRACIDAATEGQRLRDAGELRKARDRFVSCTDPACPEPIRDDCARWASDVSAAQPSVVFGARDGSGRDLRDVRVREGDVVLAEGLDGRPVALDPGPHTFHFEGGQRSASIVIVLRAGEGRRQVIVDLAAPELHERPPTPSRPIVPLVTFGGLAVAAAGLATGIILHAHAQESELEASCAPRCTDSDTAGLRRSLLVGNVALAGSIAALAGFVFFLVKPSAPATAVRSVALAPLLGPGLVGPSAVVRY